jgi:hypothetical protein
MNDIRTILALGKTLKILNFLSTTLTVGIIGFTVFRIIMLIKREKV